MHRYIIPFCSNLGSYYLESMNSRGEIAAPIAEMHNRGAKGYIIWDFVQAFLFFSLLAQFFLVCASKLAFSKTFMGLSTIVMEVDCMRRVPC